MEFEHSIGWALRLDAPGGHSPGLTEPPESSPRSRLIYLLCSGAFACCCSCSRMPEMPLDEIPGLEDDDAGGSGYDLRRRVLPPRGRIHYGNRHCPPIATTPANPPPDYLSAACPLMMTLIHPQSRSYRKSPVTHLLPQCHRSPRNK